MWATLGSWGREGIGFLIFLVLARLLGPEAYGLVGLATVTTAFAQMIVSDVLQDPLVQRDQLEREHLNAAFWTVFVLAIILSALINVSAETFAALFEQPELAKLLHWLSVLPILQACSTVPIALLRRELRYRLLATRAVIAVVIGGTIGITMALNGGGAMCLVVHMLAQSLVSSIIVWSAVDWRPGAVPAWQYFRDLRAASAYIAATHLSNLIQLQGPRFLIGYFLGPAATGVYTVSWRIVEILFLLVIRPLSDVALSAFSRMQKDLEQIKQAVVTGRRLCGLLAFPVFAGGSVVAPEMLHTLLGDEWNDAIPVMRIFGVLGITMAINSVGRAALSGGLGRWDCVLMISATTTTIYVLAILLIGQTSVFIIALALSATGCFSVCLNFMMLKHLAKIPIKQQLQSLAPLAGATLVMMVVVHLWRLWSMQFLNEILVLATSIALGGAVYLTSLMLIDGDLLRQTRSLLVSTMPSKKEA